MLGESTRPFRSSRHAYDQTPAEVKTCSALASYPSKKGGHWLDFDLGNLYSQCDLVDGRSRHLFDAYNEGPISPFDGERVGCYSGHGRLG